ncbi:MAG: YegS/Rv2252/BmrU family lipid kinase [Ferruginibacter sp.]
MVRKLIFLVNPISGTKDKGILIDLLEKRTRQQNLEFIIQETSTSGNYSQLKETIVNEHISDVIVCGGDGTLNQVAAALQGVNINIGIIPMGSGNGLAMAAGIPINIQGALDIIFKGKAAFIDSFYINEQFSCMLCGLGFDAQVAHDFAKQKKRGFVTYIRQTIKNFFITPTYPFIITDQETEISTHAFFISIANSNQFGNNVRIAPKAFLNDGLLDIVVVNKMSKMKMLYALLFQLRSGQVVPVAEKKFHQKDIHYFQSKKLSIQNPGLAPLHIDGDPSVTAEKFDIQIIENAFRLIQP